jgi:NAD(P)-dependent dehydrogenase (short-subunit alcohol dehydrogenase family)
MTTRFSGKVAVITGVNDRGIGSAIAERLAAEGAALMVLWLEQPERLLTRCRRRKFPCHDLRCDVTEPASVTAAIDACLSEYGQIDVLVNNAGVESPQTAEEITDAAWAAQLDVNLTGAMRMTRAALPYLAEPGGVIVNMASALGLGGSPGYVAYSASKAGLIGMTRALALELAPRQQRAVCVAPALVHTPMVYKHLSELTPETARLVERAHPFGMGTVHDVAHAVAFLASAEAAWISGITLPLGWVEGFALPVGALSSSAAAGRRADDRADLPEMPLPRQPADPPASSEKAWTEAVCPPVRTGPVRPDR